MSHEAKTQRRAANAALRLFGTAVLTLATMLTYGAGLWTAWTMLFVHLPYPWGLAPFAGAALAPILLVVDIVSADRADRRVSDDHSRGKDESMD